MEIPTKMEDKTKITARLPPVPIGGYSISQARALQELESYSPFLISRKLNEPIAQSTGAID